MKTIKDHPLVGQTLDTGSEKGEVVEVEEAKTVLTINRDTKMVTPHGMVRARIKTEDGRLIWSPPFCDENRRQR